MSDNAVLYTAVYTQLGDALADMGALEQLHEDHLVGRYDAAIIDQEQGTPHIVDRAAHPAVRVIPDSLGKGPLSRRELHEAARTLEDNEVALVVVGEPTLQKGFEKAVTRAGKTATHEMNAATDELARELAAASKT